MIRVLLGQLTTSLELYRMEGIMVCKPINWINFELEEMYDAMVWVFMTVRLASVFDANIFCHHISQLTQLISWNIPHP
jgi:hypothetical protein